MKRKWLVLLMSALVVGLLSGCVEQVESLLSKANDLLDEQLENEEVAGDIAEEAVVAEEPETVVEEPATDDVDVESQENDGHGPDDGQGLTVQALIDRGDYDDIDLPNGFPLTLPPDDWRLVQMIKDPADGYEEWQGFFCFDTEITSTAVDYEAELLHDGFSVLGQEMEDELSPDLKYVTEFQYNDEDPNVILYGTVDYIVDDFGTSCATVYFVYNYKE